MSAVLKNHLHAYVRSRKNKTIYKCTHPDCRHYCSKDYLEGKRAECPKCHEPFILDIKHLVLKTPTCIPCSKRAAAPQVKAAMNLIDDVLKHLKEHPLEEPALELQKEEKDAENQISD